MKPRLQNHVFEPLKIALLGLMLALLGCGPDADEVRNAPLPTKTAAPAVQVPLGPEFSEDRPYVVTERTAEEKELLKEFGEQLHQKLVDGAGSTNKLDRVERAAICLRSLGLEVSNGGMHQYYFNSSGEFAMETPEVLRRIGARDLARIVTEANLLFGSAGPNPDWEERRKQLREMDEQANKRFDELTHRYYQVMDRSDLSERFDDYVVAERTKSQ